MYSEHNWYILHKVLTSQKNVLSKRRHIGWLLMDFFSGCLVMVAHLR